MIELTGFQRDILYVVSGLERPSGMAIQDALADYYGSAVIAARVYQNLDRLADRGLVEKGAADSRTNYYELTSSGRDAIRGRRAWEERYLDVEGD